jgi:hypothetical protein
MRQIIVLLSNGEIGLFSEEQVRLYIEENTLSLADLGKEQGDLAWLPLGDILAQDFRQKAESMSQPLSGMKTPEAGARPLPPAKVRKQNVTNVVVFKRISPKIVSETRT